MKSRLVLKDIIHSHGRMQTEMFAPTPSTLFLKTMLAASSHDRNNHSEEDYIAIVLDVHTAFLHADIHQDLYAEPPEESEFNEDEVWKLHNALYGYRKAPRLWHQHVVTILDNPNFHSLLTDPSCFRNDGLLFGPNTELQRLIEHLSRQVMMRSVGKLVQRNDQVFFLGGVIKRTVRGYSVGANPKYIRDVIAVPGLEQAKPATTPSVKRTPTTELLVELENERRAVYRTPAGKLLHMWQELADIMYSVKETAQKIMSDRE